ncbi:MAG: DUF1934 domain-containing protein [Christensenellaceae bacterium]|nr:DUF1934 domain-containing protein [Christensenellaceae bacterium]
MNEILLNIRGCQMQGDETADLELTTQGVLTHEDGASILRYNDSDDADENVETIIAVKDDVVTMQKIGSVETQFVFERGKTFITAYRTPFGDLDVTLFPTLVDAKIGQQKGSIQLEYVMDIAGAQVVNRLNLSYCSDKNGSSGIVS